MRKGYQAVWLTTMLVLLSYGVSAQNGSSNTGKNTSARPPGSGDNLPNTIFFIGKVTTSDGSAPPGTVTIVSICGSNTRREAITKPDGSFSFMLGDRNSSVMQDASNSDRPVDIFSGTNSSLTSNSPGFGPSQFDTRTLSNCELKADLHGYESSYVVFPQMPSGTTDVGTLVLRKRGTQGDAVVSVTSLQAPAGARKEFEKARAQLQQGKLDEAEGSLRKAVDDYPQYAEAWYTLGKIQNQKKDVAGAHTSFEAAVKADPSYPPPYLYLAQAAAQAHQWQEALSLTDRLLALDGSRYLMAYYYNGVANYNLDHLPAAEVSALRAEGLDKAHTEPRIEILLAMIYTAKQNYSAAAEHYKTYLQVVPEGPLTAQVKSDLAKCEEMAKVAGPQEGPSKP
jgi:cytochrome c-type biogenesis protein CcmH/NrfG